MFRKLLPHVLLCLIVFQLVGFNLYFYSEKAKIKKQLKTYLKEGVPKNHLKSFEFTKDQLSSLEWIKQNKEFKLGEAYYDIVWKKKLPNGTIRLQCVDDLQETRLFKNLTVYLDKNLGDQDRPSGLHFIFSLLHTPVILSAYHFEYQSKQIDEQKMRFSFYFQLLTEGHYSIVIPPPNMC